MNDEFYFWHADKNRSILRVDTINLGVCNQAFTKYPKQEVHIFFQYLQESMGDEVNFLPTDKC